MRTLLLTLLFGLGSLLHADPPPVAPSSRMANMTDVATRVPVNYKRQGCAAAWDSESTNRSSNLITLWTDLTGNGKDLTQSDNAKRATYTSRGAELKLGGSYDITGGLSVNYRSFTVIAILATNRTVEQWSNNGYFFEIPSGPVVQFGAFNTTYSNPTAYAPPPLTRTAGYSAWAVSGSSTEVKTVVNGTAHTGPAFTAGTGTLNRLFSNAAGSGGAIPPIKALYVFNRSMPEGEINEIIATHGVTPDNSPALYIGGDSIQLGTGATTHDKTLTARLAKDLGASVAFFPIGGKTMATMASTPASQIVPVPGKPTYVFIMGGTNDAASATGTAASVSSNTQALINSWRAAEPNAIIGLGSVLPRNNFFSGGVTQGSFAADRATINSSFSANWNAWGCNFYIDFGGLDADADNLALYGDKVHPTDARYATMATTAAAIFRQTAARPVTLGGTGSSTGSITGTGALTLQAGGTNQSAHLLPSGTGSVNLGSGSSRVMLSQSFGNTLLYFGSNAAAPSASNYALLDDGAGTIVNSPATQVRFRIGGTDRVSVTSTQLVSTGGLRIASPAVPATATSTGIAGDIAWDATHFYVCTAANTWVRVTLAAW
ncbi:SGNH/GDSL hydrolase family protein [Luteolibacter luteus]|uniref:SGNH/GDSL hydrolase family protein n=1 Tax=Luteolibacter luteus TaxID=2728835 RepID=A0A858RGF1_9BACT|nr:SGNH/GDSL hydrolase family protein [Luteolibacter luteus]QJE95213.1 SGNH/GDSL hydrolase family protein [Luteolibacter luteus]